VQTFSVSSACFDEILVSNLAPSAMREQIPCSVVSLSGIGSDPDTEHATYTCNDSEDMQTPLQPIVV
jgi:hypothetical protein